jgi:hypothetical protein
MQQKSLHHVKLVLAYVQGIGIVASTTTEAKMRKIIYPTYDNPPTTDEERALIERLKAQPMSPALAERIERINKAFGVKS